MYREEFQKAYGRIITQAWSDAAFKEKFLSDPIGVFKENGIEVPEGVHVKIVENTDEEVSFILPSKPGETCGESVCGAGDLCTCFMFNIWKKWF
jgi:hypothetical protein